MKCPPFISKWLRLAAVVLLGLTITYAASPDKDDLIIDEGKHTFVEDKVVEDYRQTDGEATIEKGNTMTVEGDFFLGKDADFKNEGTLVIGNEQGAEIHVEPRTRTWTTIEKDDQWQYSCKGATRPGDCVVTQTGGFVEVEHSEEYTPSLGNVIIQ